MFEVIGFVVNPNYKKHTMCGNINMIWAYDFHPPKMYMKMSIVECYEVKDIAKNSTSHTHDGYSHA